LPRAVEPVVRGPATSRFPDTFGRIEFRRVRRQPVQLDSAEIFFEPLLTDCIERVARTIVDDEEDLPTAASPYELL
jgi:hypothetical protein